MIFGDLCYITQLQKIAFPLQFLQILLIKLKRIQSYVEIDEKFKHFMKHFFSKFLFLFSKEKSVFFPLFHFFEFRWKHLLRHNSLRLIRKCVSLRRSKRFPCNFEIWAIFAPNVKQLIVNDVENIFFISQILIRIKCIR